MFLDLAAIRFSLRCFFSATLWDTKKFDRFPYPSVYCKRQKRHPFRAEPHLAHYREYPLGFELFVMDLFLSGGKGEGGGGELWTWNAIKSPHKVFLKAVLSSFSDLSYELLIRFSTNLNYP